MLLVLRIFLRPRLAYYSWAPSQSSSLVLQLSGAFSILYPHFMCEIESHIEWTKKLSCGERFLLYHCVTQLMTSLLMEITSAFLLTYKRYFWEECTVSRRRHNALYARGLPKPRLHFDMATKVQTFKECWITYFLFFIYGKERIILETKSRNKKLHP